MGSGFHNPVYPDTGSISCWCMTRYTISSYVPSLSLSFFSWAKLGGSDGCLRPIAETGWSPLLRSPVRQLLGLELVID